MSDQRLRLTAELKNQASPALKQLSKDLKEVRVSPGMTSATTWFRDFNETSSAFVKGGGSVASVMGSIGVGGLTAALSLSGLVAQLKQLGDSTFAMKRLGLETGLTIDQVNQWEIVGQHFHVSTETMSASLKTLGDNMRDIQRHRGDLFGNLNQFDAPFAKALDQSHDPEKRMEMVFGWLSRIKDAADRNRWAKMFFGSDELDALLVDGLPKFQSTLADVQRTAAKITPEFLKQSDLLNSAVVDFNTAWQNFEVNVGPTVFSELTKAANNFRAVFDDIKTAFGWFEKAKNETTKDFIDGTAKSAGAAFNQALKEKAEANAKAAADGKGPLFDLPGLLNGAPSASETSKSFQRDRGNMNPLFHKSSFETFTGGSDNPITSGTKEGVLAAFREWASQSSVEADASKKAAPGLQNASYEGGGIFGRSGSRGGSGFPGADSGGAVSMKGFGGKPQPGKWWTADREQHAVDRLMKEAGLSQEGAEGLVSRWANVEARQGPTAHNPISGAIGIGQWLGSRKHGFTADYDSQLSHAINELNNNENGGSATRALRAARDAREGAIGASRFERAEQYNPRTGVDDWTGKSMAGAAGVHSALTRHLPSLTDEARKAEGHHTIRHEGGATIEIRGLPEGRGATIRNHGLVTAVNLVRGPTMTQPNIEA